MKKSLLLSCALISLNAHALVDYSETVNEPADKSAGRSIQKMSKPQSSGSGRSLSWKADMSLETNYESLEVGGNKYGVMNFATHIQTPVDVYFDASYWHANGDEGSSSGNPKLILGFNWLRFGNPSEEARVDIYGGAKLSSSSKLGSSRTDKIIGAETTKRFGTFGLGIGYDVTLVGKPKNSEERAIGNISRLTISGGWMVSNDIQFEIEAESFSIDKAKDTNRAARLGEKVSFSTLSPKVNLGLAPAVNLELGARFRMKKAKSEADLMSAKVFDLHGANSNSLFAGLNLTI
ncbi:hypothetical protein C0V70_08840 [Bacteriovorax stolpii]|uniref:Uncharacterized protein n=1 Tax=Bacteriovorax stolpii TaxID=960 RepID=A0A2K9NRR5_BACTC|nr:hypothetical protein [Bacteriovorax stolpii]AUN98209.1 hypothetical protein C0V70_08840 [Bacteriovorax stolpii]TDP52128.1 hypothetical protein C8D79_2777 [Bacteriovorax stolpii]